MSGEPPSRGLTELSQQLPGVDPTWSRLVEVTDADGVLHRWHVLDNGAQAPVATMVCVHGNPTWSYLWRRFLAEAPPGWRVVAVDQLGMGWSDRPAAPRPLATRVDDLARVLAALEVTGPVVSVAHDWGGPISLGWSLAHRDQLVGVVLGNTGVELLGGSPPPLIGLARTPLIRQAACVYTPTFVRATTALSRPALPQAIRDAFALPYRTADRRQAVGDFVADIPVEADHPSRASLEAIAAGVETLRDIPVLLLWGARDPVFSDRYLHDLIRRLPHADVQRYGRASHLVTEDAPDSARSAWQWIDDCVELPTSSRPAPRNEAQPDQDTELPWARLLARAEDSGPAVAELGKRHPTVVSFAELEQRVRDLAAGLSRVGVTAGQRVALLVPPGVDLTVAVYACWRIGAVIVVADAGLGLRPMGRALRGAGPDHVIGIARGLAAAGALRVPGQRVLAGTLPDWLRRVLGVTHTLSGLAALGHGQALPAAPESGAEAAVLFTSGATGPAKGVVYRQHQLKAQIDLLRIAMGITGGDRLVAAFAPFALYGPALGIGAAVPDMDVTAPGTLTARALADAAAAVEATVVFASPAALRNVAATAGALTEEDRQALGRVKRVMSAGAPVPVSLLRSIQPLMPAAELHTPYGMTEALPCTDISLPEIEAAGPGNGVCVGHPMPGVSVLVSPMGDDGSADGDLTAQPEVTGEVCVAAAHVLDHYDRLWVTERARSRTPGWHRTGDVGHFDAAGRLWVEGRLVHVVTTAAGPLTPVGVEQRVEELDQVAAAAVVGVGPVGLQQVVVVVVPAAGTAVGAARAGRAQPGGLSARLPWPRPDPLAAADLSRAVRAAAGVGVAAVLTVDALPVDIRHASKVDRARVGRWAARVLSGGRGGRT